MKPYLPFLSLALIFTSCSAYKTGQTPDDVYYSKPRQVDEYVRVDKQNDQQYQSPQEVREDEYMRLNIYDRRWSSVLDDEFYNSYTYNPYNTYYNSYIGLNSPWNYYNYWNYYYNPYCNNYGGYYGGGFSKGYAIYTPVYNKPRTTNLFVFNTPANGNSNTSKTYRINNYSGNNNDNYRGSGTNAGNFLRNAFNNSNSGNNNSSRSNSNSSTPSSSGSSSSGSSSSSSSAPVRRF